MEDRTSDDSVEGSVEPVEPVKKEEARKKITYTQVVRKRTISYSGDHGQYKPKVTGRESAPTLGAILDLERFRSERSRTMSDVRGSDKPAETESKPTVSRRIRAPTLSAMGGHDLARFRREAERRSRKEEDDMIRANSKFANSASSDKDGPGSSVEGVTRAAKNEEDKKKITYTQVVRKRTISYSGDQDETKTAVSGREHAPTLNAMGGRHLARFRRENDDKIKTNRKVFDATAIEAMPTQTIKVEVRVLCCVIM